MMIPLTRDRQWWRLVESSPIVIGIHDAAQGNTTVSYRGSRSHMNAFRRGLRQLIGSSVEPGFSDK